MINWIKEHKIYLFVAAGILLLILIYMYSPKNQESIPMEDGMDFEVPIDKNQPPQVTEKDDTSESEILMVDVKGAVNHPGVYEAVPGERVLNLINKAGGLKKGADESNINFAMRVADEMVLYIPAIGEEMKEGIEGQSIGMNGGPEEAGKVNINKADETELQTLTGVGPAKAKAIIQHRETNGPFKTVEDLMSISGFGEKTFEKLKESITVN